MIKTTSLDLSRKVMEAGITLEDSEKVWASLEGREPCAVPRWYLKDELESDLYRIFEPAPTACELLEVMPKKIKMTLCAYELTLYPLGEFWHANYYSSLRRSVYVTKLSETPADALAMLCLWLVEQGLWEVEG